MAVRVEEIQVRQGRPRIVDRVRGWLDQESILGPVFVTPALLLLLLLVAYPFLMALYFSLSNAFIGRPSQFIGIRNFVKLWESDAFRQTFQNAFVFTSTLGRHLRFSAERRVPGFQCGLAHRGGTVWASCHPGA